MQAMIMRKLKSMLAVLLAANLLMGSGGLAHQSRAAEPAEPVTEKSFAQYQTQIKPQPGESRWMDVPWFLELHEARQKAAKEGKPLFLYSDKGATGIGACSKAGRQGGRAPTFWTEENTKLIQEHFVAVSLYNPEYDRTDAVGQYLREAGIKLTRLEASLWCVTAGGKILDSNLVVVKGKESFKWDLNLKEALEKWKALPEAERAPGAVKVGELGAVDTQLAGLTPPAGTLILKLHYRAFMRDDNKFRYLTPKDLWYDEKGAKTAAKTNEIFIQDQAHPDHMWLAETEWKSLMPANPRMGDKFPLPAGVADRLVRWHLNPRLVADGRNDTLDRGSVRAAELNLTVDAVSADRIRLRLDGHAKLGKQPAPAVVAGKIACIDQWGFEPELLGFLEYDPKKQVFTRFDLVALGDHFGKLGLSTGARPGCQPLGITFELVKGDRPADRVPPGRASTAPQYFDPKR